MASHKRGRISAALDALIDSFVPAICPEIKLNRPQSTVWSLSPQGASLLKFRGRARILAETCVWNTAERKQQQKTALNAASFLIFLDHFESLLTRISFGEKQAGEASVFPCFSSCMKREEGALAHNFQNWIFAKANSKIIFR